MTTLWRVLLLLLADVMVMSALAAALATRRGLSASSRNMVWALGLGCALFLPLAELRLFFQTQAKGDRSNGAMGRNLPWGTEGVIEYNSPKSRKVVFPNGLIYETVRHEADPTPVASGYRTTLLNGYTIQVAGVAREVGRDGMWAHSPGPWWGPDGTPLPKPPVALDWRWREAPTGLTHGVAPTEICLQISPPTGHLPAPNFPADASWFSIDEKLIGRINIPLNDSYVEPSTNSTKSGLDAVFNEQARTCSYRVGIATGSWKTVATLSVHQAPRWVGRADTPPTADNEDAWVKLDDRPALIYEAARHPRGLLGTVGVLRVDYFLGSGGLLGHMARRVVVVDVSGNTRVLQQTGTTIYNTPFYNVGFGDLAQIKKFRLQTRPYQTVQFRDIHLQPRIAGGRVQQERK